MDPVVASQVSADCCVCVMAKAPVAGQVKTRMCPPLSEEQAAQVATAFLLDTWSVVRAHAGRRAHLAWAGDRACFPPEVLDAEAFPQSGDGLGARIESTLAAGLRAASRVVVVGSDMPGLPGGHLLDAERALDEADVVLGPSRDGGFYLIAARRYRAGMLAGVPWSVPSTYDACRAALEQRGFAVATITPFDDVDDMDGLRRLCERIAADPVRAPATAALLSESPWSYLLSSPS